MFFLHIKDDMLHVLSISNVQYMQESCDKEFYNNDFNCYYAVFIFFKVRMAYTFFDYIVGGCQLNFTIGVDFTGSNGDPKDKGSLHYLNPHAPTNQYTEALTAVGNVVQDYDT